LQTEEAVREELFRDPGATDVEQRARLEAAAIQLASPKLERAAEHVLHPFRPLLDANPRAMKAQHRTALWTIPSLRWPRLAEYLATHPDAAMNFGESSASKSVPTAFVPLFTDPEVEAVVFGQAEGVIAKLDADSIRLSVSA
jgi:hypothetical protein